MDCHVEPTSATADSIPPCPLHDPLDSVPIGSPEDEILSPPSDDDLDHDHGHENEDDHGQEDQVQNHEIPSAVDVLTDDLKKKIIKQASTQKKIFFSLSLVLFDILSPRICSD